MVAMLDSVASMGKDAICPICVAAAVARLSRAFTLSSSVKSMTGVVAVGGVAGEFPRLRTLVFCRGVKSLGVVVGDVGGFDLAFAFDFPFARVFNALSVLAEAAAEEQSTGSEDPRTTLYPPRAAHNSAF